MNKHTNCAVFMDRDGTVVEEVGYLNHPDLLKLIPQSAEAITRLNQSGLKVVLITNQSGVARGYFSEQILKKIHNRLKKMLLREKAYLDGVYYCPHHPDEGCDCRKPKTGMLELAANELDIDLRCSFVIGDKMDDVEAAHRVGAKGILVLTGYGREEDNLHRANLLVQPDYIAQNLYEAVRWILNTKEGGYYG
jgi:D-glycero-D-manno-heptose 1,7-bisphosphate phosphatase